MSTSNSTSYCCICEPVETTYVSLKCVIELLDLRVCQMCHWIIGLTCLSNVSLNCWTYVSLKCVIELLDLCVCQMCHWILGLTCLSNVSLNSWTYVSVKCVLELLVFFGTSNFAEIHLLRKTCTINQYDNL